MQPAVVMKENAHIVRENTTRRWKKETLKKHARKAKYRIEDLVRISRGRRLREKIRVERGDIYRVLDWRNPHVYELRDLADKVIVFFYEQELTRDEKNLEEEQFIVDRVIKSRGRGTLISKCLLVSAVIPASLILGFQLRI